jgi:hypothetical protein
MIVSTDLRIPSGVYRGIIAKDRGAGLSLRATEWTGRGLPGRALSDFRRSACFDVLFGLG